MDKRLILLDEHLNALFKEQEILEESIDVVSTRWQKLFDEHLIELGLPVNHTDIGECVCENSPVGRCLYNMSIKGAFEGEVSCACCGKLTYYEGV